MKDLIPTALSRRLVLALLGFRCVDGRWICPCTDGRCRLQLTEEAVDSMPEWSWQRYVRCWLTSATSMN